MSSMYDSAAEENLLSAIHASGASHREMDRLRSALAHSRAKAEAYRGALERIARGNGKRFGGGMCQYHAEKSTEDDPNCVPCIAAACLAQSHLDEQGDKT